MRGRARVVAFFLPQFHQIPENDAWWGEGFTEWTNVRRAAPLYAGHDHPRRPAGEHYFDLTDEGELSRQAAEARAHGVDGFCVYFYWFDGACLLERPLDLLAELPEPMPYMLSWANENWSRTWDGRDRQVLKRQEYREDTAEAVFADLLPHLRRPQYLRHHGRPMLMVHRTDLIPDPAAYAGTWRRLAVEAGLPGLHLIAAETRTGIDPRVWGFDALAEFPPVTRGRLGNAMLRPPAGLVRGFAGRLLSYHRMEAESRRRPRTPFTLHRGVLPAWDNTARRGTSATVVVGGSPAAYHRWLRWALRREHEAHGEEGVVFVNAWNEWAEGAYLQPDATHGAAYLEATLAAAEGRDLPAAPCTEVPARAGVLGQLHPGHVRALANAAGASVLGGVRTLGRRRR